MNETSHVWYCATPRTSKTAACQLVHYLQWNNDFSHSYHLAVSQYSIKVNIVTYRSDDPVDGSQCRLRAAM